MSETPVDSFIGLTIRDRYTIEEVIGRGGMATVYRARDVSLERAVALKLFRVESTDAEELRRQRSEMQLLARLSHPGLVTLFDAGVETSAEIAGRDDGHGRGYLVMELVDGDNLGDYLFDGPLKPLHVSAIGAELAEALFHIHRFNVVHRDVKPANILLVPPDIPGTAPHVKLTDFGIALLVDVPRVTGVGTVIGTASYLSPEQALGQTLTPATDVYSLGLVLLECLTGIRAFPGAALESARARILHGPSIPQNLPHGWTSLLSSMTTRDPENRPNALDVARACRRILHRSTVALSEAETTELLDFTKVLDDESGSSSAGRSVPLSVPATIPFSAAAPVSSPAFTMAAAPAGISASASSVGFAPTSAFAGLPARIEGFAPSTAAGTTAAGTISAGASRSPHPPKPAGSAVTKRDHRHRVRTVVWTWGIAALIAASAGAVSIAGAPESPPVPTYAPVSGVLGTHLQDLQKSVEP